jgi:glycosyltransferase involved in cell wall biosynthesis
MASGVPVVSTDCGGPATLIDDGQTGFLVPTGDADALAARMAHLLTHPREAAAMGRAGRSRVEQHFSVEAAGERFLRVYDELLA